GLGVGTRSALGARRGIRGSLLGGSLPLSFLLLVLGDLVCGEFGGTGSDLGFAESSAPFTNRLLVGADLGGAGDGVDAQVERASSAVRIGVVVDPLKQPEILPGGVQAGGEQPVLPVDADRADPGVVGLLDRFDVQPGRLGVGAQ